MFKVLSTPEALCRGTHADVDGAPESESGDEEQSMHKARTQMTY